MQHMAVLRHPDEVDAELDALVPVSHELAEQIAELPPRPPPGAGEGPRAAGVLATRLLRQPDGQTTTMLLGWSLARDLAGDEAALPARADAVARAGWGGPP